METDGDAAMLRIINDALEKVRRRKSWTIEEAMEDTRSGEWERRRNAYRTLQANAGLAEVDPWDLPPQFPMPIAKEHGRLSSLQTHSGYWKEKEDEFKAIRSEGGGEGSSSASSSPPYQELVLGLEFYEHNRTKTDWVIHEFNLLDADMFVLEDLVARKVLKKKHTDRAPLEAYLERPADDVKQQSLHGGDGMLDLFLDLMGMAPAKFNASFVFLAKPPLEGCEEAVSECAEVPTASAAPDGESDNVWQNFTKINTKDPHAVYAACHRCDRVLKAHSKNGTSHLRRHRKTKACTCHSNPSSTTEDLEILRELRANLHLYKQGKIEGRVDSPDLNASVDPWDLPTPHYFTNSLSWKTHQGRWEEIQSNDKHIAIRIGPLPVQQYAGLKRTFQFHHDNGTKMDWIMLEYHLVDEYNTRDLLLEESMVFRKVIQIFKDAVEELERMWNGDDDGKECYIGDGEEQVEAYMSTLRRECLLGDVDQSRVGKRKRTGAPEGGSKVWLYFTKIYTTDPDRVYAVCHSCDRGYKFRSKNGTSQFIRHNQTCSSKHRKV